MSTGTSSREVRRTAPGGIRPRRLLGSLVLWLATYALLLTLYNHFYHTTSGVLIHALQILPAVFILELTLPGVTLTHTPVTIISPQLNLQIMRGCDGVEVWLMLLTALLVFPMPWRRRLWGMLWGTLFIYVLNIARLVSLFHIALKRIEWFETAHTVVWQSVVVLAAAVFVLIWMSPRTNPDPGRIDPEEAS